jgi:murein DD-endopeptidase MepM/ murein hydrolase activator NlpD
MVLPGIGAVLALVPLGSGPRRDAGLALPYVPRTAHQAYGYALAQGGLLRTPTGRQWLASAERALREPVEIDLPFRTSGRLEVVPGQAWSYAVAVPMGRELQVTLAVDSESVEPARMFLDLYRHDAGPRFEPILSGAPLRPGERDLTRQLTFRALEDERFLLRFQPALHAGGPFELTIDAGSTLQFPVQGLGPRAVQSGFGAERDGGARSHRGIDIFAPRGTPVLAAIDAWVTRVDTTTVGGRVVWLQDLFSPLRLYYAHLDSHGVAPGQYVPAGTILGTVGNSGNARTTSPHLHFGVYVRRRGARDPQPFLR